MKLSGKLKNRIPFDSKTSICPRTFKSCLTLVFALLLASCSPIWYKNPFDGDLCIKYEACVVDHNKVLDRVSDLNCFWMASDPHYPDSLLLERIFERVPLAVIIVYSFIIWDMAVTQIQQPDSAAMSAIMIDFLLK